MIISKGNLLAFTCFSETARLNRLISRATAASKNQDVRYKRSTKCYKSPQSLSVLFGAEGADAIEAEAEDDAVFFANPYIEGVVLNGERAAVVGIADRVERADERRLFGGTAVFEIEE